MILRVLLLVAALMIIGCTEGLVEKEDHLYAGAPIVSIKQTDFNADTGVLKYRLEVQEPLPYTIRVKLEETGGLTKKAKELTKEDDVSLWRHFPIIRRISMLRGWSVSEHKDHLYEGTRLTISILRWEGGYAPYNVGSPHTLTVKRNIR